MPKIYIVVAQYDGEYGSVVDSAWSSEEAAMKKCVALAEESESLSPFEWYGDSYTNAYSWYAVKERTLDEIPSPL